MRETLSSYTTLTSLGVVSDTALLLASILRRSSGLFEVTVNGWVFISMYDQGWFVYT